MKDLDDVQSEKSIHKIPLSQVGLVNLEYPAIINWNGNSHNVIMDMKMSVDLPKEQRGAHLSRFMEKIEEEFSIPREATSIEVLAETIAHMQLLIHDYSDRASVDLSTKMDLDGKVYGLFAKYDTSLDQKVVGVKVMGAIACPCSIQLTGGLSHNQRAEITLEIEANGIDVDAEDLVRLCDRSFSTPLKMKLKRPDEKKLVEDMHANPMFVEDVVRKCVHMLRELFNSHYCRVKCVSFESIHPYDVYAEWNGTL